MLHATFGGGEANVAVSLAHFGFQSYYVTRVPANPVGDAAVRALRAEGVRSEFIQRGGSRLGICFAETGASQRASTVVYDRAGAQVNGFRDRSGQRAEGRSKAITFAQSANYSKAVSKHTIKGCLCPRSTWKNSVSA